MGVQIPDLQFTSLEAIPELISAIHKPFLEHKARDHQRPRGADRDLNKPRFETEVAESGWLLNDIVFTTRNLHEWVKDERAPEIELAFKFMSPKIRKDPLSCVTSNFPFQLTLGTAIGAIAAGNTVVIKPSENAPHSAAVIQKICEASLDPSCYSVIQSGVSETQALLRDQTASSQFLEGDGATVAPGSGRQTVRATEIPV